ncbi:MAG: hypothetical protein AABX49_02380, partial [Nanoarchaeota archaeon]
QKCNFIENSWNGNNVRFLCITSTFDFGSQTAKCTIDPSKSYQSGADQTAVVNIVANTCSQYSTSSSCNADPTTRCGWCDECSGIQWSGGVGRCLDKNSCSFQLTANKCGAVCDATVGCSGITSCDNLDGCYDGKFRDYQNVNQWCDLNNGQCKNSICSTYIEAAPDSEGQDPLTCKDGVDNDCDGLIDCADLGCAGKTGPNNLGCCQTNSDCSTVGQCGEGICAENNICGSTVEKANKQQICNDLMPASYQCAKFFACSAATDYNCQYVGDSTLCADKHPLTPGRNPYDTSCSMKPDFRCNVDVCISPQVTSNPCCLCYSQCITAANNPNVAPESPAECNIAKNFQWTNAQCPFIGGG